MVLCEVTPRNAVTLCSCSEKIKHIHPKTTVACDMSGNRIEFPSQKLDPETILEHREDSETGMAYSVDFPAPLAPTMAIRESKPMSKYTFFRISLSG